MLAYLQKSIQTRAEKSSNAESSERRVSRNKRTSITSKEAYTISLLHHLSALAVSCAILSLAVSLGGGSRSSSNSDGSSRSLLPLIAFSGSICSFQRVIRMD